MLLGWLLRDWLLHSMRYLNSMCMLHVNQSGSIHEAGQAPRVLMLLHLAHQTLAGRMARHVAG